MKMTLTLGLFLFFQGPLVLANVASADLKRIDVGQNVRVEITINYNDGTKPCKQDFFLNDDVAKFKTGTLAERAALRKKYIRQAIKNCTPPAPPAEVDMGTQTVPKTDFEDPGDL